MSETNKPDLNISITFRHTDSSQALKTYAEEKITGCISKYLDKHAEARLVLTVEKRDHIAELNLHSGGYDVIAKGVTEDLYSAIDKMIDSLDTQLRKQKEKMSNHKHQPTAV